MAGYKKVRVNVSETQVKKAMSGKSVRLTAGQIGSGETFLMLHPANAKIVEKAALKNTGCVINLSHGELLETASQMDGSGFWSSVWNGLKSGWNALKKSGILSAAADTGAQMLGAYTGQPAAVSAGRKLLKDTTGIGANSNISKRSIGRMNKTQRHAALQGRGLYLS